MAKEDGLKHIHNIMHVFIEGIANGMYDNLDDIQCDACEYLAMEKAVEKLSNWNEDSKVEDLAKIFDGISNSMASRNKREKEEEEWHAVMNMPQILEEEENGNSLFAE